MQRKVAVCVAAALFVAVMLVPQTAAADDADKIPEELEAAVTRALDYLAAKQNDQGYWSDNQGAEPGVVGLAVLAYLAHGEMPGEGKYGQTMTKCINYILSQQQSNGLLSRGGSPMYNHGFATLALAEVYGQTTDDERIGRALKSAVDLIVSSQNSLGGWRYSVGSSDADITVSGCQMMALRAAANAGIEVPAETIKRGAEYIRSLSCPGGGFGYTSPGGPNTPRTGIGILVLSLTGYYRSAEVKAGADWLLGQGFSNSGYYYYALYYCSQAMFQAGGRYWETWNSTNISTMLRSQNPDGSWTGQSSSGGPAYSTIMSLLSLEVNWKLLPIYQR